MDAFDDASSIASNLFAQVVASEPLDVTSGSLDIYEKEGPPHTHPTPSSPPEVTYKESTREFLRLEAELTRLGDVTGQDGVGGGGGGRRSHAIVPPPPPTLPSPANLSPAERAMAEVVATKVAALQEAMAKYESRSAALEEERVCVARTRAATEEAGRALLRERGEFHKACSQERGKLEAWKAEEAGRLEKERRVAVRQARAAAMAEKALPDRKERAELEQAKATIAALKADLGASETRYRASVDRHRGIVARLEERVGVLEAQVKAYEAERIGIVFGGGAVAAPPAPAGPSAALPKEKPAVPSHGPSRPRPAAAAAASSSSLASASASAASAASGSAPSGYSTSYALTRAVNHPMRSGSVASSVASSSTTPAVSPAAVAPPPPPPPPRQPVVAVGEGSSSSFSSSSSSSPLQRGYNPDRYAGIEKAPFTGVGDTSGSSQYSGSNGVGGGGGDFLPPDELLAPPEEVEVQTQPVNLLQSTPSITRRPSRGVQPLHQPPPSMPPPPVAETGEEGDATFIPPVTHLKGSAAEAEGPPSSSSSSSFSSSYGQVHAGRHAATYLLGPPSLGTLPPPPQFTASQSSGVSMTGSALAPPPPPLQPTSTSKSSSSSSSTTTTTTTTTITLSPQLQAHLSHRVRLSELRSGVASAHPPVSLVSQSILEGGKVESRFADGTRLVRFKNGTERETAGAGGAVTVRFANGDVRRSFPSGVEVYFYQAAATIQTTYPDGGKGGAGYDVYEFPKTAQVELHWGGEGGVEACTMDLED